jgi:hypothetical protein
MVLLTGCRNDTARTPSTRTIRIGVLYPFSGPDAATGEDLKAGLDLAVEIINHSHEMSLPLARDAGLPGQAGRGIELVFRNTESDPAVAARELKSLVSSGRGIVAVMGCYHSSVTAAASEQAEMQQIPFLNSESTSPLLVQRGLKWFFRTTPDDMTFSRNFFELLNDMRTKGLLDSSRPLVLVYSASVYRDDADRVLNEVAERVSQSMYLHVEMSRNSLWLLGLMVDPERSDLFRERRTLGGEVGTGDVKVSSFSRFPQMPLFVPVFGRLNQVAGVICADMNISRIWRLVSKSYTGKNIDAYIVDRTGILIAFDDLSAVLDRKNLKDVSGVKRFLSGVSDSSAYTGIRGTQVKGVVRVSAPV